MFIQRPQEYVQFCLVVCSSTITVVAGVCRVCIAGPYVVHIVVESSEPICMHIGI